MKYLIPVPETFLHSDGSTGTLNYMRVDYDDTEPEFQEWLEMRYHETPRQIYDYLTTTGRYGDYNKAMEYLRGKYRQELREQRNFFNNNPFKKRRNEL